MEDRRIRNCFDTWQRHSVSDSHSVEEAEERHAFKRDRRRKRQASGDGTR